MKQKKTIYVLLMAVGAVLLLAALGGGEVSFQRATIFCPIALFDQECCLS